MGTNYYLHRGKQWAKQRAAWDLLEAVSASARFAGDSGRECAVYEQHLQRAFDAGKEFANRKPLHIGKSSVGWVFLLASYEDGPRDFDEWRPLLEDPDNTIMDEYGRQLSPASMIMTITIRRAKVGQTPDWHERNGSEPAPHGLARPKLGPNCIAHGPGTWALVRPGFS